MKVGVLALQGDFDKHCRILNNLGIIPQNIRYPNQLEQVEGLIIPGGESTTMSDLINRAMFYEPIRNFSKSFPVLGTCAGLIMMAKKVLDEKINPLALLDITVERNAYGSQIHSFTHNLGIEIKGQKRSVPATFIRAPKIYAVHPAVEILSKYNQEYVAVRQGKHVGLAFHPELDNVSFFHELTFMGNNFKNNMRKKDRNVT
ncbi:MAG: pyridoxal 5'-phosphate synthase glutaminase subunit PdxT [Candidatus Neomarinimicrobiota bacterium]